MVCVPPRTSPNCPSLCGRAVVTVRGLTQPEQIPTTCSAPSSASAGGGAAAAAAAAEVAADDGRAEVVVSFAVAPRRRLRYALHLSRGTHTELDDVVTRRARTVTVRGVNHDFAANADGEELDPAKERTWRVVPEAYRLHTPEETT